MESLVLPQILHPSIFYRLFGLGSRRQQSNEYNTKECGITQGPHLGARPRVRAPMLAPGGRAFAHGTGWAWPWTDDVGPTSMGVSRGRGPWWPSLRNRSFMSSQKHKNYVRHFWHSGWYQWGLELIRISAKSEFATRWPNWTFLASSPITLDWSTQDMIAHFLTVQLWNFCALVLHGFLQDWLNQTCSLL